MENACYELQRLTRKDRQALCERAEQLAAEAEQALQREFLLGFGDGCGLLDEE
jgi:hypothetical protein